MMDYSSIPENKTAIIFEFDDVLYRRWQRMVSVADRERLFTPEVLSGMGDPRDSLQEVLTPLVGTRRLNREKALRRALYFEAKTFLHGLFVVEDKLSMAHGLETRVPFLDNDLVDLVWRLPASYKVNMDGAASNGKFLSSDGKVVLRQAMRGVIPESVLRANKQGFSSPDESWYRYRTTGYIREVLLSERSKERGYFQPEYVEKVIDEHVQGKVNHRLLIWSFLCFE
ncbi:MAG: asparagine synthase C-terminal domain-containing protein, partial [Bacteroidetes bacterium]|nr:asparagine synthase C-terminal domain-containing protein [Bacteroidota bacterium]MBU1759357.1 asparagine synthase C-terminal domain-containing protein [Bacteroidota bacterium]